MKYKFLRSKEVRYPGIIIERDEEYSQRFLEAEGVQRQYISTRDAYMIITKNCRKTSDNCFKNERKFG